MNEENSYLSNVKAVDRLMREWHVHQSLIIGFDFDGTIYDYHNEGLFTAPVISLLQRCSNLGFTMCLFSLTTKDAKMSMAQKVQYCKDMGINVSYVNDSPVLRDQYPNTKPYFNILLDDRAGLRSAYYVLLETLNELGL